MIEGEIVVGDLVEFTPPAIYENLKKEYAIPGIVVKINRLPVSGGKFRESFTVRWHDGKTTSEHRCYIGKVY